MSYKISNVDDMTSVIVSYDTREERTSIKRHVHEKDVISDLKTTFRFLSLESRNNLM